MTGGGGQGAGRDFDFVVGVGASAGGLEALERLLASVPPTTTKAFVVAQHLSPEHKSMMVHLLSKRTALSVVEAYDDAPLAGRMLYLVPPHANVVVVGDRIRLSPRATTTINLPIDELFRSLAEVHGDRAVCVVLSGTGSDGKDGVAAVKGAGGVAFVQDPSTARFAGMPREAIRTGLVDAVLSPEDIAAEIEKLSAERALLARFGVGANGASDQLDQLATSLQSITGFDLRSYKRGTVIRRLERRMKALDLDDFTAYLARVRADPVEARRLTAEILIHVTEFFRDPEAFDLLAREHIPELVAQSGGVPLRVWVAGCATGEEAYSIAMLLTEQRVDFRLYATDIDADVIARASAGHYSEHAVTGVSPERLSRFFVRREEGYEIDRELRRHIVFATHDVLADPPFVHLDLISCRNLLIYLTAEAQRRVVDSFVFALKPKGRLLLGPSELPGDRLDDLITVDQQQKLFAPRGGRGRAPQTTHRRAPADGPSSDDQANVAALRILTNTFAAAAALVSEGLRLVRVYGNASKLLTVGFGEPSLDLPDLLPESLRAVTTVAVHRAFGTNEEASLLATDETLDVGLVRALPFALRPAAERYAVVIFERRQVAPAATTESVDPATTLERELVAARRSLQTAIEELETSNEELQAMNEELVASNEELQATNEELQSVNEELHTVNAEHQMRIGELVQTNADLDNLLHATPVATLFLDEALKIRRFNAAVEPLFSLVARDEGRPLAHFTSALLDSPLTEELQEVMDKVSVLERAVSTRAGRRYLLRAVPHLLPGQRVGGVVMTFADVTSLHETQRARDELQAVIDAQPSQVAVIDERGIIERVNFAWEDFGRIHGRTASSVGLNYLVAAASEPVVVSGLRSVLDGRSPTFRHVYVCVGVRGRPRFLMLAQRTRDGRKVVVSHTEITGLEGGE